MAKEIDPETIEDVQTEDEGFAVVKAAMSEMGSDSVSEDVDEDIEENEDESSDDSDSDEQQIDSEDDEVDADEDDSDQEDLASDEDDKSKLTIDDIDAGVVKSARLRGWDDERILKYAVDDPDVLQEIHTLMSFSLRHQDDQEPEDKKTDEKKELPFKKMEYTPEAISKLNELYGEGYYEREIKPLVDNQNAMAEHIASLSDNLAGVTKTHEQKTVQQNEQIFNEYLDAQSKKYPELGTWSKVPKMPDGSVDLTNPVVQTRVRLWTTTKAFQQQGLPISSAVKEALDWYKGKTLEKSVQKNVVKDLNKRKKKFTPRPTSKKVKRKFKSEKEEGLHIVSEALEKVGLTEK